MNLVSGAQWPRMSESFWNSVAAEGSGIMGIKKFDLTRFLVSESATYKHP